MGYSRRDRKLDTLKMLLHKETPLAVLLNGESRRDKAIAA
jgi:hypothetical protein